MEKITIGQLSKITGVTIKAIRFYEQKELIKPYLIDEKTKYRYYATNHIYTILLIKIGRELNISLKDIKHYLDHKTSDNILLMLKLQEESLKRKIDELIHTQHSIHAIIKNIQTANEPTEDDVYIKTVSEKHISTISYSLVKDFHNIKDFYAILCNKALENKLFPTYNYGVILSKINGDFDPTHFFIEHIKKNRFDEIQLIPKGVCHCISYTASNYKSQQEKLRIYLEKNHLEPQLMIQQIIEPSIFDDQQGKYELQAFCHNL